jgi:hypothetical protein
MDAILKIHLKMDRCTSSLMIEQVLQTKWESPVVKTKRAPKILSSRLETIFQHDICYLLSIWSKTLHLQHPSIEGRLGKEHGRVFEILY